ncbi:hypothetical protein ACTI_70760 [Actinoplanes sp. OR16]|uniref:hypothetical protein n=1 Tax=Actinoplanes sp. OR16 TaxID=946334 RepID=UPI000F6E6683|nr:hypothetical protein [Actinoplanes sp. OR16]BBH70391.1 hypothetical protein ACTI_70760 [Actinoplanes sp. OR16]
MAGNEHEVNRSSRTGRFVKESTAHRQPDTTTTETVGGDHEKGDREVNRSAKTGKFVTETTAQLHADSTEKQKL